MERKKDIELFNISVVIKMTHSRYLILERDIRILYQSRHHLTTQLQHFNIFFELLYCEIIKRDTKKVDDI